MKTCVRVLPLVLLCCASVPAWGDPPDPEVLLGKLSAPPKSYADAKARCANPKDKSTYLSSDPQNQALADEIEKQTKAWETAYSNDMKSHMAQNMAASQASAMDPRQMMAMAQMQQAMSNTQLPPDPAALAEQLFQGPATLSAIQANEQEQQKSSQDWQGKYQACAKLPIGADSCQKVVAGKANTEAADIGKRRGPLLEKYYSGLAANWPNFRDGVQKYLDAITLAVPAGVDPKGYQVGILLNTNLDRRLQVVHDAAARGGEAICPNFLYEAEQQYGGICMGEGC